MSILKDEELDSYREHVSSIAEADAENNALAEIEKLSSALEELLRRAESGGIEEERFTRDVLLINEKIALLEARISGNQEKLAESERRFTIIEKEVQVFQHDAASMRALIAEVVALKGALERLAVNQEKIYSRERQNHIDLSRSIYHHEKAEASLERWLYVFAGVAAISILAMIFGFVAIARTGQSYDALRESIYRQHTTIYKIEQHLFPPQSADIPEVK